MIKLTKPQIIRERLNNFEVGDMISKRNYVFMLYQNHNLFLSRCFDVHLGKAKKMMPDKKFRTIAGMITRVD